MFSRYVRKSNNFNHITSQVCMRYVFRFFVFIIKTMGYALRYERVCIFRTSYIPGMCGGVKLFAAYPIHTGYVNTKS